MLSLRAEYENDHGWRRVKVRVTQAAPTDYQISGYKDGIYQEAVRKIEEKK